MFNKKTVVPLVALVVVVVVLGLVYFKHWREPEATYVETDDPKLIRIRADLEELKADLRDKGMYVCCIRNDCNWCAVQMGHCPCAELVMEKGNEKSCPECAAAWNRKRGKIPGVDPDAIKVTTFGVYGYEKGGHHPREKGEETHNHHEAAEESRARSVGGAVKGVHEIKIEATRFAYSPDPIVVKKGEKVRLLVKSTDVKHGIAIEEYSISEVLPPHKEKTIEFIPDRAGEFDFFCNVYCGAGHGRMRGKLIVTE